MSGRHISSILLLECIPADRVNIALQYARLTTILARELLAGVGLTLPLLSGGRIECQEVQTEKQLRFLERREEALTQQVELETRNAWFQLKMRSILLPD